MQALTGRGGNYKASFIGKNAESLRDMVSWYGIIVLPSHKRMVLISHNSLASISSYLYQTQTTIHSCQGKEFHCPHWVVLDWVHKPYQIKHLNIQIDSNALNGNIYVLCYASYRDLETSVYLYEQQARSKNRIARTHLDPKARNPQLVITESGSSPQGPSPIKPFFVLSRL